VVALSFTATGATPAGIYVNWSDAPVPLVPPVVVTVRSTMPLPAGEVAVIEVALFTVNVAFATPNLTPVAPVKLVPVIATEVPPDAGPLVGATTVTVGARAAGATTWNWN
jgi:hypothetical protein